MRKPWKMTPAVRARMRERIADRREKGLSQSWLSYDFGSYPGWKEALEELIADGRVERRVVPVPDRKGGHPTLTLYFAREGGAS